MSALHNNPFLLASGSPTDPTFPLQRSVRLRSSASAYFNRTPASATNRQKYTLSLWFKRGTLSTNQALFSASDGTQNNEFLIYFDTNNALVFQQTVGGSAAGQISCSTSAVFRDPSSWYHAVVAIDTTQATSTNRLILYINGIAQTFSSYSVGSSINTWVDNTNPHALGKRSDASLYFDGYMTEVNFVDGQALTPSSFGGYNSGTGVWEPRKYTGTYGTNGFYLPFNYTNTNLTGNLITYSEDFSNASWTKYQASITTDATTAPNGTTTADKLIATATVQDHLAYKTFTAADNTTYCLSVYAKNAGYDICRLYIMNKAGSPIGSDFFLSTQTFNAGAGCTCAIVSVGNGWYRCSVSLNVGTGATATPNIYVGTNTGATNGDGTSGIFIWGAQFEQNSSVSPYFTTGSASTPNSYNLGADQSLSTGGYNSFITNNISLTLGATYDSMLDVPTNTSPTNANFPTLNPLNGNNIGVGNLQVTGTATGGENHYSTIALPTTGKWYCEMSSTAYNASTIVGWFGVSNASGTNFSGLLSRVSGAGAGFFQNDTLISSTNIGALNTIFGLAVDRGANTITIYLNNVAQGTVPTLATGVDLFFYYGSYTSGTGWVNFGQRPFTYTPPTGYLSLNTYNLPAPTIANGAAYMAATLYTGNGATQSITNTVNGVSFQPDFVWGKLRNVASGHGLYDSVRGATKWIASESTAAETTYQGVTAFNSNGFSLGSSSEVNNNGSSIVAWQWKASNAAAVTNTSGSISSQVSANQTAGFSIVTYTGTGGTGTVGHGLGVAANFIIIKKRSAVQNWFVGGSNIASAGNGTWSSILEGLNTTAAINTGGTAVFNSTAPTSSVFSVGADTNGSGATFVAYCWSAIAGYSAFGKYTGNGSTDGVFVYTGMRPRWLLIKNITTAGYGWNLFDTSRSPYNIAQIFLQPNSSNAETNNAAYAIDLLSNGFKLRQTDALINASGSTYIYAAFAENPFSYSLAR